MLRMPGRISAVCETVVPQAGQKFIFMADGDQAVDVDALIPEDWLEEGRSGRTVRRSRKDHIPKPVHVSPEGTIGLGQSAWFIRQPFSLCMNPECGAAYGPRARR